MEDFFQSDDKMATDPADLGPAFFAAMAATLAKELSAQHQKPWLSTQETDLQEKVSALVADCNKRGLKNFRVIATRPDGAMATRELNVDKISKTRSLQ
jgi:hypothetical protein